MNKKINFRSCFLVIGPIVMAVLFPLQASAETEVRSILELYNTVYRGEDSWYYTGNGKADIRFDSIGNRNLKAEVAVDFYPVDLSGGSSVTDVPPVVLKRFWVKSNFPSLRLTLGKTKVAWGNGYVFNSGDVIFGSIGPYVDFTESTIRDETAWLTAFNIPTGRFSYIEAVVLPPSIDNSSGSPELQTIDKTSGGVRFFANAGGWKLETGYLYKGDAKAPVDLLGSRPYFSFHTHAGVDLYGAVSLAAGWDGNAGKNRNNWAEVSKTVNISFGAYHQIQAGYDGILTMRLEGLVAPWQNWHPVHYQNLIDETSGYYGIFLYPEVNYAIRSWSFGVQGLISPVDASAQITANVGWNVFQGFTLLSYVVINTGNSDSIYAYDRSGPDWPDYPNSGGPFSPSEFNGVNFTLGARYTY